MVALSRELFITPLAHYWAAPCCSDPQHLTTIVPGYLPRLGEAASSLRDHIRDVLYTRRIPNFRILCPNRMKWGQNAVHPTGVGCRMMAKSIETDTLDLEARYTR